VQSWHAGRPGQGARTDLTYLPSPDGHRVFINPTTTTITTATLLHDLTGTHASTITKKALQQRWTQQFADDNHTPLPQPTPYTTNPPTTRQITTALNALHKLGAIHHNRLHITITDHPSSFASRIWHDSRAMLPRRPAQQTPADRRLLKRRQGIKMILTAPRVKQPWFEPKHNPQQIEALKTAGTIRTNSFFISSAESIHTSDRR
jgi:hypothetical protein